MTLDMIQHAARYRLSLETTPSPDGVILRLDGVARSAFWLEIRLTRNNLVQLLAEVDRRATEGRVSH